MGQTSIEELCPFIVQGDTQRLMLAADLAITKSGSVNLELALHNVSMHFFSCFLHFCDLFSTLVHITKNAKISCIPDFVQQQ
jgi:hypothetical protein